MMLSVMVMGAGAAFTDQDKIVNEEAVDMISALGIVDGYEDDSFQPEKNIERGEAAKMIAVMLNGGKDAVQDTSVSSFNDVLGSADAWANKYIEYCASEKIVAGVGGDRFAPASNVTGTQLAKMLLVSLGYDPIKEGYQNDNTWAVDVNTDAVKAGLFEGIENVDMSAALTRDNAAQMIWNALQADTVWYTSAGEIVKGHSLLDQAYDAYVVTGTMTDVDHYNKDAGKYTYTIAGVEYTSTTDYSDMFAMNVTAVVNYSKKALNVYADYTDIVAEGTLGDIQDYQDLGTKSTVVISGEKIGVDNLQGDTLNVVNFNEYSYAKFDGTQQNTVGIWQGKVAVQYGFRAIDTDNGGDINTIVVYPYAVLSVDDVDNDDFTVSKISNQDAKLFPKDTAQYYATTFYNRAAIVNYDDVIVNGELAKDGYVKYVPAANTAEHMDTYTALTVQNATPSSLNTKDQMVTLNGTEYDGTLLITQDGNNLGNEIDLTKSYDYVEVNGYLFMMDGAGLLAPTNYAVVTDQAKGTTGTTANLYATDLLLTTGETVTVNATAKVEIGTMVTYTENNAGNYVLTAVTDGTYEANTSIYTVQEVNPKNGANSALNDANDGAPGVTGNWRYDKDDAGYYFLNEAATGKYYIKDDAVIFVYYNDAGDDYYDVITGKELKETDLDGTGQVRWSVTGANKQASGQVMVEMGYVAIPHDIGEVTYEAYIDSVSNRKIDSNGDFYVDVTVMLPGGEMKLLESKHCETQNDALLQALYAVEEDNIYSVTLLNDKVVHVGSVLPLDTDLQVEVAYDPVTKAFKASGLLCVIDENTNVYSLKGKDLTEINAGDVVRINADASDTDGDGVVVLKTLVYTD